MKKPILTLLSTIFAASLFAQDATVIDLKKNTGEVSIKKDPKDTINTVWKKGGTFNLNVNQGSLSNWSAGGDKFSFSLNAFANMFAFYKKDKHSWDNSIDMTYGMVQTTSLGTRKSSDRIDFTTKYGYALHKHLNAATLFNFRSQFAKGFAYVKDDAGKEVSELTSKTFMPAYVLLSIGLDYKPSKDFSLMCSPITGRWVLVSDKSLGPLYGLDPGKTVKSELGAFLSANYQTGLGKGFSYKSKLDLFSNYKSKPQNIDIFWTNVITAKLTKYINFSFNLDMIYDDNTHHVDAEKGPAPQWLQLMGIGFSYQFVRYR